MLDFMEDALPRVAERERTFAAGLVGTVISAMGKAISSQNRSNSEVDALAVAVGEMLCGYLERYSRPDGTRSAANSS